MSVHLSAHDWLQLFLHFLSLSLLAVGGAITTAPDMQRYLVTEQAWLSDEQFAASMALAQAAPGPNVLFVALMGWHVGLNAGSVLWATLGVLLSMLGILLPSTVLTYQAAQWGHRNRHLRWVRAFKQGLAPIVVALLLATGWVLASSHGARQEHWPYWLLTALTTVLIWRTRIHMLWLLGTGALFGAFYGL